MVAGLFLLASLAVVPNASAGPGGEDPCANPTTPLWVWAHECLYSGDPLGDALDPVGEFAAFVGELVTYVRCEVIGGPAC